MKAKKVKRVVLGVGHPWFLRANTCAPAYTAVGLDLKAGGPWLELKFGDHGHWNRVRLVNGGSGMSDPDEAMARVRKEMLFIVSRVLVATALSAALLWMMVIG